MVEAFNLILTAVRMMESGRMVALTAGEDLGPPMVKFSRASGVTESP